MSLKKIYVLISIFDNQINIIDIEGGNMIFFSPIRAKVKKEINLVFTIGESNCSG